MEDLESKECRALRNGMLKDTVHHHVIYCTGGTAPESFTIFMPWWCVLKSKCNGFQTLGNHLWKHLHLAFSHIHLESASNGGKLDWMDIWGVKKKLKNSSSRRPQAMVDEEVHWGMPWLIPPLRGRALLFRPGAEVEILWKLREVVSRRMEIGSSFKFHYVCFHVLRFISTTDCWWICWWGHYPLLVFMTQQHCMALVLLGSELKMGANGGRDKDSLRYGSIPIPFVPHYLGMFVHFISTNAYSSELSCYWACAWSLEVTEMFFPDGSSSNLKQVPYKGFGHKTQNPASRANSILSTSSISSILSSRVKLQAGQCVSLDCHPRVINLERALYNDTMSIPSPQVSRKTQFFKTYFEATSN